MAMMPDRSILSSLRSLTDMDIKTHLCALELTLAPVGQSPPWICVKLDDHVAFSGPLRHTHTIRLDSWLSAGAHQLNVDFSNKGHDDSEQAVVIQKLLFNGIEDKKFIWQGRYRPQYPEPWFTQQLERGQRPRVEINNIDYLGWNGNWCLEISSPIFTWIHKVQDLGWIYD